MSSPTVPPGNREVAEVDLESVDLTLDPAILDEDDPFHRDAELDLFAERALPLDRGWVTQYREAQAARMDRITAWVKDHDSNSVKPSRGTRVIAIYDDCQLG